MQRSPNYITSSENPLYGSFAKHGNSHTDPKILQSLLWGPQKGTPNFGNLPTVPYSKGPRTQGPNTIISMALALKPCSLATWTLRDSARPPPCLMEWYKKSLQGLGLGFRVYPPVRLSPKLPSFQLWSRCWVALPRQLCELLLVGRLLVNVFAPTCT